MNKVVKNSLVKRIYIGVILIMLLSSLFLPIMRVFAEVPHTPIDDNTEPKIVNGIMVISKEYPVKTDPPLKKRVEILPGDIGAKNVPSDKQRGEYGEEEAVKQLSKLLKEANSNSSLKEMYVVSGHRDISKQKDVNKRNPNNPLVSKAHYSEHHTGLAFDVTTADYPGLSPDFGNTKEGKWLAENASKYGFIIRYEKDMEHITGYTYEPWHLRYIGTAKAKEYTEGGYKTLEEYLGIAKDYSSGEGVPIGEGGEGGESSEGGTFDENSGTEKRDPFDPFLPNFAEPERTGVSDGSIVVPPTIVYGFTSLTQKIYKVTIILTQIILALSIVLISLQAFVLAYRVRVGDSNHKHIQKAIDMFTGNIPPEKLVQRIFINMGLIVMIFLLIYMKLYVVFWATFYNILDQIINLM